MLVPEAEFPPPPDTLIPEDVRALFAVSGVSALWSPHDLGWNLRISQVFDGRPYYVNYGPVDVQAIENFGVMMQVVQSMWADMRRGPSSPPLFDKGEKSGR